MATRSDLVEWVEDALRRTGGEAGVVEVARAIWDKHEEELRKSGDLFYTWQYDMRWAAQKLRNDGKLAPTDQTKKGRWALR